jgi:hypothetical protein
VPHAFVGWPATIRLHPERCRTSEDYGRGWTSYSSSLTIRGEYLLLPHLVSYCHTLHSCRAHEEQVSVASINGPGVTLTLTFPRAMDAPPGRARTRFGPCFPEAATFVPVIAPGAKQGGHCPPSEGTAQSFRLPAWHSFCSLWEIRRE